MDLKFTDYSKFLICCCSLVKPVFSFHWILYLVCDFIMFFNPIHNNSRNLRISPICIFKCMIYLNSSLNLIFFIWVTYFVNLINLVLSPVSQIVTNVQVRHLQWLRNRPSSLVNWIRPLIVWSPNSSFVIICKCHFVKITNALKHDWLNIRAIF